MVSSATEIMSRLYPCAVPGHPGTRRHTRRIALPDRRDARMVLPDEPSLARRAVQTWRRPESFAGRMKQVVFAGALSLGAARFAPASRVFEVDPGAWCIDDELGRVLGRQVRAGIFLGPPRANRKPVLHLYDDRGRLVAVAKVGINDLTARLARSEAAALRTLAATPRSHVVVPELLAEHEWNGMTMVVQSPLPVWKRSSEPTAAQRSAVFSEIATSGGIVHEAVHDSAHTRGLRARVLAMADAEWRELALAQLDVLGSQPPVQVGYGAWHGDLTAWNMTFTGGGALVWDWERFESGVPVGYDVLHHEFLPSLKAPGPLDDVAARLLGRAPTLLATLGIDRVAAEVVTMLYLIEIAVRFTADGQAGTGVAGGDAREWLLPVLGAATMPDTGRH